jgi:hypothetical protein
MTRAGREVLPADVISPNVLGEAMLRFVVPGLFHWTLLKALNASARI